MHGTAMYHRNDFSKDGRGGSLVVALGTSSDRVACWTEAIHGSAMYRAMRGEEHGRQCDGCLVLRTDAPYNSRGRSRSMSATRSRVQRLAERPSSCTANAAMLFSRQPSPTERELSQTKRRPRQSDDTLRGNGQQTPQVVLAATAVRIIVRKGSFL